MSEYSLSRAPTCKRAMILAAGRGTRLAPLTDTVPKPMLPLAGKPLIQWQIEALQRAGVTDVVINLHHLGEQISNHLGDGRDFGVSIQYSHETTLLETGGGIVAALPLLQHEPFWLLNGDVWTDFDFATLPPQPPPPYPAHIVLTATPDYREHGDFEYVEGRVTRRGDSYVYCCIAALHAELFDGIQVAHFSLRELYFKLIDEGRLSAQLHHGIWQDIGTLEQYQALEAALRSA